MYYTRVTRMCAFGHAVMKQNETKKKKRTKILLYVFQINN